MSVSIVIPVLNEAAQLPAILAELAPLRARDLEIIVVDGGSMDASVGIAMLAGVKLLRTRAGRARQMNVGAAAARGELLLFLHADTRLPRRAIDRARAALADKRRVWGRFNVRIQGGGLVLWLTALLMNLRSRLTGIATGDQAIFVTRRAFHSVGGYPYQPLMEDIELSRRLLRLSRPACLQSRVVTSGRRWQTRGVWRTILLMWRLRWSYWRGVSADQLAREYQ